VTTEKYVILAGKRGVYSVAAKTRAHAVAALTARLGLTEAQTEETTRWAVCRDKPRGEPDDPAIDQMRYHMEGML